MIDVVCGIISNSEDRIFIARRKAGKSMAGKWEFPGGKLEEGESGLEALKRELIEELGMNVKDILPLTVSVHHYDTFSIRLIAYTCEFVSATYELTDHDAYEWVKPEELTNFDLAEADRPLLSMLTQ